ncbi:hypothetical protein ACFRH4_46660 [Streptomyces mirabilis]|uniref:hypothetical protein n=1 Tax=Streptomyces mirabilis TaxID=68239 RepID=UPI0036B96CE4
MSEDTDPPGGSMASLAEMLTAVAQRAARIEPDREGDASCPLHEAAALVTDNAGMRLIWAAHGFDPAE